jgi:hypothetical protein
MNAMANFLPIRTFFTSMGIFVGTYKEAINHAITKIGKSISSEKNSHLKHSSLSEDFDPVETQDHFQECACLQQQLEPLSPWEKFLQSISAPTLPTHVLDPYTLWFLDIHKEPGEIQRLPTVKFGDQWFFGHFNVNDYPPLGARYHLPGGLQLTTFQSIRDRFMLLRYGTVPPIPPRIVITGCEDNDQEYVKVNNAHMPVEQGFLSRTWGPRKKEHSWQEKAKKLRQQALRESEQKELDMAYGAGKMKVADNHVYDESFHEPYNADAEVEVEKKHRDEVAISGGDKSIAADSGFISGAEFKEKVDALFESIDWEDEI